MSSTLEVFVGSSSPSKVGCTFNRKGNLVAKPGYFLTKFSETAAKKLKDDEYEWVGMQMLNGVFSADPPCRAYGLR